MAYLPTESIYVCLSVFSACWRPNNFFIFARIISFFRLLHRPTSNSILSFFFYLLYNKSLLHIHTTVITLCELLHSYIDKLLLYQWLIYQPKVYLFVCLSVCLLACLSNSLTVCLLVCLSVCLSACLSVSLSFLILNRHYFFNLIFFSLPAGCRYTLENIHHFVVKVAMSLPCSTAHVLLRS
jgi:hypothetical protein